MTFLHHKSSTREDRALTPKVSVPSGWDPWHSDNHWSNKEAMKHYVEKIIVPCLDARGQLYSSASHTQLLQFLIASMDKSLLSSYLCSKSTISSVYKFQPTAPIDYSHWMSPLISLSKMT